MTPKETRGGWVGWADAWKADKTAGIAAEAEHRLKAFDWNQGLRRAAFAVVCGIAAGAACVALCLCINFANSLWKAHRWLIWCLPALALLSIALYDLLGLRTDVRSFTGPNRIVRNMRDNVPVPARMGPAMLAGTMLSLAGGASVGPDASAKQLGASLGCLVARPFGLREEKDGASVPCFGFACAAGLAACFSALLIAPLGVFAYTVELARTTHTRLAHWPSMLLSCVVACVVARPFGLSFVSPYVPHLAFDLFSVEAVVAVGLAVGIVGTLYRGGIKLLDFWVRLRLGSPYLSALVGSLVIVAILEFVPDAQTFAGIGTHLMHAAFTDHIGLWAFAGKLAMTVLALGFGLRGGEVTPLFIMGSLLGCSMAVQLGADVRPLAALGLVTLFGVCAECPVGAVLMGCEFFGFEALPWLAVAVAIAWYLSRWLLDHIDAFLARTAADKNHSLNERLSRELLELLHHNDSMRRAVVRALEPQPELQARLLDKLAKFDEEFDALGPHDHTTKKAKAAEGKAR